MELNWEFAWAFVGNVLMHILNFVRILWEDSPWTAIAVVTIVVAAILLPPARRRRRRVRY